MGRKMTEAERQLELAYLRQRIAALEDDAREPPPSPTLPVEPVTGNVVQLRRK